MDSRYASRRHSSVAVSLAGLASVALVLAGCSSSNSSPGTSSVNTASSENTASAPGVTATSVTVGLLTSFTGPLSSGFTTVATGFKARIAMQNAQGGVDGRLIKVVEGDDGSSPAQALTATMTLVEQKQVFALASVSDVLLGAETYLKNNDVPVVGSPYDGPEWAPPDNNMFPVYGSPNPKYPAGEFFGTFFKREGATNVAVVTYNVPSAIAVAKNVKASAEWAGLKATYINYTLPLTQEGNFTAIVQQMKAEGVDAMYLPMNPTQYFALISEARAAGMNVKAYLLGVPPPAGSASNAQTLADLQNTWVAGPWQPVQLKTPATEAFQAALAKYANQTAEPDRNEYEGWAAASAIIKGLEVAGKNPTRASFMADLRAVNDFTADGLAVSPVSFTASFGTGVEGPVGAAPSNCAYFQQFKGSGWVVLPTPICGGIVPNSDAG
jgi:branched-chain amino acid transport system substrate-binding protein